MNNIEQIEEAIEAGIAEIETYKGINRSYCYFMLERLLKDYAWKCWRSGVDTVNSETKEKRGSMTEL